MCHAFMICVQCPLVVLVLSKRHAAFPICQCPRVQPNMLDAQRDFSFACCRGALMLIYLLDVANIRYELERSLPQASRLHLPST